MQQKPSEGLSTLPAHLGLMQSNKTLNFHLYFGTELKLNPNKVTDAVRSSLNEKEHFHQLTITAESKTQLSTATELIISGLFQIPLPKNLKHL